MFLDSKYPDMGRLRKRQTNRKMFGDGYKFFNPKNNDVLFHVVWGGPVIWKRGEGTTEPRYPGIRLYVDYDLYKSLENYLGNFDEELLKWFNENYKQNADRVIAGIR